MNNEDKVGFVKVLAGMAVMHRIELTDEMVSLYWIAMADWRIDDFTKAAGYLLKNHEWFPRPYDFEQLLKADQLTPAEAWGKALKHAEGAWRQGPTGDDLTDRAANAIGGYQAIALASFDRLGFVERSFKEAYGDLSDSVAIRGALPDLIRNRKLLKNDDEGEDDE